MRSQVKLTIRPVVLKLRITPRARSGVQAAEWCFP